jgi:hypothetical protein
VAVGFVFQPRPLEKLSDAELAAYQRHCGETVARAPTELAYLDGKLAGLSSGLQKKRFFLLGGSATSAAGMSGIVLATWSGVGALAGGLFALFSLADYGADARERELLRIDYRNLNESLQFCRKELRRIPAEWGRRSKHGALP